MFYSRTLNFSKIANRSSLCLPPLPLCFLCRRRRAAPHATEGGPQATSWSSWPSTRRARAPRRPFPLMLDLLRSCHAPSRPQSAAASPATWLGWWRAPFSSLARARARPHPFPSILPLTPPVSRSKHPRAPPPLLLNSGEPDATAGPPFQTSSARADPAFSTARASRSSKTPPHPHSTATARPPASCPSRRRTSPWETPQPTAPALTKPTNRRALTSSCSLATSSSPLVSP